MAIQYVGSQTATITSVVPTDTTVTFSLSGGLASTPAAGDIVLVSYNNGQGINRDVSASVQTSGYSLLASLMANDSFDANMAVFRKIMGPTPDSNVVVFGRSGTASVAIVHIVVFRGVDATTPIDVTTTTATGVDSSNTDLPAITPATSGNVIALFGSTTHSALRTYTTASTSYVSGFLQSNGTGSSYSTLAGSGYITGQSAGVSYNPAVWNTNATSTLSSWAGATVVLRPDSTVNVSLNGTSITTDNPNVDSSTIGQNHGLTSNTITSGNPSVPTINMAEDETFVGNDITTGSSTVQDASVSQDHTFTSNVIETGNPSVGLSSLTEFSAGGLGGISIVTGTPVVDESVFSQNNSLSSSDITTSPSSVPAITMAEDETFLGISVVTGIPSLASGIFTQAHSIESSSIITEAPIIGSPLATQEYQLTAANINAAPPTISEPTFTKVEVLSTNSITTGVPSVGSSSATQTHTLSAVNITVGSPIAGTPVFALIYGLSGVSILSDTPIVSSAYINASKRRVISVDGNTANTVVVSEAFNSTTIDENNAASLQNIKNSVEISDFNSASYRNEHNRVA